MYMGAVTVFLFILGLLLCNGRDKWWIVAATLLAVLLSLGSHFMWFTKLFYDYAPLYNKFRTVSMALVVLQFTLPLLAFTSLSRILLFDETATLFKSKGWIALAVTGGFCLLFALFPSLAGSFSGSSDAGSPDVLVSALATDRRHLLVADAFRSLLLVCGAWAVLYWGVTAPKSAPKTFATQPSMRFSRRRTAALLVCALALFDVWMVSKRYLNSDDFTTPRNFQSQFALRPVDKMILEDPDPSYRVVDLTVDVFNDSHPSYHHKNIGGYSPAKMQRYQEFIDGTLRGEISTLYSTLSSAATVQEAEESLPYLEGLAKMNCRYIIVGEDVPPLKYRYAKGNAWFKDSAAGEISLTSYAPNELRYDYSSESGGEVVFSEVYYPVGWSLRLEDTGEEIPVSPAEDGFLRGAVLPSGSHSLVMRFSPPSYTIGERVSRASSIAIILIVLCAVAGALVSVHPQKVNADPDGNTNK